MARSKPNKKELARMKAMSDLGFSPHAIAKRLERDPKTVRKYLHSDVFNDPDLNELITLVKSRELNDLYLLGAKGRQRLHELLDRGDSKMIETIALVDRTFNQRRLLEGGSTTNLNVHTLIESIDAQVAEVEKRLKELDSQTDN